MKLLCEAEVQAAWAGRGRGQGRLAPAYFLVALFPVPLGHPLPPITPP